MGVCSAVRDMALALAAAFDDDQDFHRIAEVVATMPAWKERRRLDEWERQIHQALPDRYGHSLALRLIDDVADFGQLNLYTRFQVDRTQAAYNMLTYRLSQHGIVVVCDHDVSVW